MLIVVSISSSDFGREGGHRHLLAHHVTERRDPGPGTQAGRDDPRGRYRGCGVDQQAPRHRPPHCPGKTTANSANANLKPMKEHMGSLTSEKSGYTRWAGQARRTVRLQKNR